MMGIAYMLLQAGTSPGGASGAGAAGGESSLLVWGVVLLSVAVALLLVELLLPSGGLIGLCAAAAAVGGLVCLFYEDTTLGLVTTLAVLLASPFLLAFMLRMWPHTPIGRMLILGAGLPAPGSDDDLSGSVASDGGGGVTEETPDGVRGPEFPGVPAVGATGVAHTGLRPVGTCVFAGRRVECLAEAGMIDAGAAVRVVSVEGTEVRVREGISD